ncbi:MAG: cell wall-binding repeat-containing protein, partial [Eggerthellales bacterium]|nr:cell wall-binding repeat-containing protein [Eggerthellales bacterium]
SEVIIAMSSNFQDALSISTYAYYYKVPLLLENQDFGATGQLTSDEIAFVKTTSGTIYVPGGPGAVSEATVEDIFGKERVSRLWGNNGYDTSNVIATKMLRDGMLSPDYVGIACGAMDPKGVDALAGAALIGSKGGIMLLDNPKSDLDDGVNYTTIKDAVDSKGYPSFLQAISDSVGMAYILGGNYVAPQSFYDMVKNVLGA